MAISYTATSHRNSRTHRVLRRPLESAVLRPDFTHPFAMTILGNPARQLFTPIILQHLLGNPGNVPANELWTTATGTL